MFASDLLMRCVVVAALLSLASADVYMQNPRGSNNKLNEVSNNVNNANRLFDSQYVVSSYHTQLNRSLRPFFTLP